VVSGPYYPGEDLLALEGSPRREAVTTGPRERQGRGEKLAFGKSEDLRDNRMRDSFIRVGHGRNPMPRNGDKLLQKIAKKGR